MDILQNNKPGSKVQNWFRVAYWNNNLLLLYIFTMPFVSAFAFTGTISLPLIFAVILFMLMGIHPVLSGKNPEGFVGFDLIIISLFLFLVIFSFAINGWGNAKSFNHTLAYISTFLLFYVSLKFTVFNAEDKDLLFKKVLQFIAFTTIISAVYTNFEFISSNFFAFNLNEYIPRSSEDEKYYEALELGLFYRARGFASESGHFAFMMELFSPLTVYYMYFSGFCKWYAYQKTGVIISIFFSFIFAASAASFLIVPVAVLLAALFHIKKVLFYVKRRQGKFLIVSSITSLIIILLNYFFSFNAFILLSLSDKLGSSSFDDRQERIDFFFNKFSQLDPIKKLIGVGPAGFDILAFDESKSILSLYYSLTFELGFLGVLLVLLLFVYFFIQTLKIRTIIGFFLLTSLICGFVHYYFIANFWFPWFWFLAVFAIFCSKTFQKE